MTRRDVFRIGTAHNGLFAASNAFCGAIAGFALPILTVELYEHRVVDVLAKRIFYRLQVHAMAVRSQLDAIGCSDLVWSWMQQLDARPKYGRPLRNLPGTAVL